MFDFSSAQKNLHVLSEEIVFSVSEISTAIKGQVEKEFKNVKIRGEISGIKRHSSGHIYFTLKDQDSVINGVCWKGTKLQFQLEDGLEIILKGAITVYPSRSQYQVVLREASLAGEGALLKLLNERKKLFKSLGYFENRRMLPKYPRIIGIVTSKTGAVLQDMRHRLEDRYPFCDVLVWPVNVQGKEAAEQVASAVRGFNFMTDRKPDVLIVARGGGSIEDLWPFNEEVVVKSVFNSLIPVISAIGHETDYTLIDEAADLRAPTPTAAIEFAVPVLSEIAFEIEKSAIKLKQYILRILKDKNQKIQLAKRSLDSSQFAIMTLAQRFDDKIEKFEFAICSYIQKHSLKLESKKITSPKSYILLKEHLFKSKKSEFERFLKNYIDKYTNKFEFLKTRLEQSSYKKILEKGFCFISNKAGQCVKTTTEFDREKGNGLEIHFQDGCSKI